MLQKSCEDGMAKINAECPRAYEDAYAKMKDDGGCYPMLHAVCSRNANIM
jgi:hypothetical protein